MPEAGIFGPTVATIDVEGAVLSTLRLWVPEWITATESAHGLLHGFLTRPPAFESFHGGDDFESWKQDLLPEYIVDVKPASLERESSAGYTVAYEVQIAVIIENQDEEEARTHASLHAAALMFLVQQPSLGGLAERLVMTAAPGPEFLDPSNRRFARAIGKFTVWVAPVVDENLGPAQPEPSESPYYEGEPEKKWKELAEATKVEEAVKFASPWTEGREYAIGALVEERGVFYESAKLQAASEVHKPSADSAHSYWKVV